VSPEGDIWNTWNRFSKPGTLTVTQPTASNYVSYTVLTL